jgi:hypothetical protein
MLRSFQVLPIAGMHVAVLRPRSASCVDNERVFSGTGRLREPKRNRLTAKNGSMLAFLNHNICEIDMEYDWPK